MSDILPQFGWKGIVDLGDITSARGTEMRLPMWIRLWGVAGSPPFNSKVARWKGVEGIDRIEGVEGTASPRAPPSTPATPSPPSIPSTPSST